MVKNGQVTIMIYMKNGIADIAMSTYSERK